MTKRAILWCGQMRRPNLGRDEFGRTREVGDPLLASDDFKIQANGLELAFQAALSLGVTNDEIYIFVCDSELLPQRFHGASYQATVLELQRVILGIAGRAARGDALLFIAVNHGTPGGLLTSEPVSELDDESPITLLTPDALDHCLRPFQGQQVLVIAACYAGSFLPLGSADRAVLVSCAPHETYKIPREGTAWSALSR
jgi:hypothetical protein